MMENSIVRRLEEIMKELSPYERQGLDTSSLKIFIKSLKEFVKHNDQISLLSGDLSSDEKLNIVKLFLEDRAAFPTINDIVEFAIDKLQLDFRDQKVSRGITIDRIMNRFKAKPELKDTLKSAVISLRNEKVHKGSTNTKSKQDIVSAETFMKWAEIIKNI